VQYLVVDQNVMRKQVLETSVQNDPQTSFIITDTALVEFVKHPRWEHTMRGSLELSPNLGDERGQAAAI